MSTLGTLRLGEDGTVTESGIVTPEAVVLAFDPPPASGSRMVAKSDPIC